MKQNYQKTMYACFIGYIVQAVVNNFVPLLFVTFQKSYGISLSKVTLLITINFCVQLLVDMLSAGFVDKIGYRASVIMAHIFAAAGLLGLTFLPDLLPNAYAGIVLSVVVYAIGGGLIEVLISPILEACPTENKEKAMSLLHSFYCWGHMGVVLLSTAFFALFGVENWKILTLLWVLIPVCNTIFFATVPLYSLHEEGEKGLSLGALFRRKIFWFFLLMMLCAGIGAGSEPVGIYVCRAGAGCHQNRGRPRRSDVVRPADGNGKTDLRQVRRSAEPGPFYEVQLCAVHGVVFVHRLCSRAVRGTARLCGLRLFCGNPLAGNV